MRTTLGVGLILALAVGAPSRAVLAQEPTVVSSADYDPWTSEELENLLAPIALYPDPILAQVLIAATYPDQVIRAAEYVGRHGTDGIDQQPWEISVKAVAHYSPVLNLMAEGEDWMVALGQAYAMQPTDVMAGVQSLRRMANAQGNLESTPQQQVVVEREVIRIEPAQPRIIYVPVYDPAVVYFRPIYLAHAHPAYWSWGIGYPVGAWLSYDFDWWGHRVYYHGWNRGPRWVIAARPWIVISPIYVAPRHTTIIINRRVVHRTVNYRNLRRHTVVHRNTTFDRRDRFNGRRDVGRNDRDDRRDWDRNDRRDDRGADRGRTTGPRGEVGRRVAPVPVTPGRRVGPPGAGETTGGRRVGPPAGTNTGRRLAATPSGDRTSATRPARTPSPAAAPSRRVTPLSGAPMRRPDTEGVGADAGRSPAGVLRTAATSDRAPTTRSSNGTWNPRAGSSTTRSSTTRSSTPVAPSTATRPSAPTPSGWGAPAGTRARPSVPARPNTSVRQSAPIRTNTPSRPSTSARPSAPARPSTSVRPSAPPRSNTSARPSGRQSAPPAARSAPSRSSGSAASPRAATGRSSGAARSSGGSPRGGSARASGRGRPE